MKEYVFSEELSETGGQLNLMAEIGEVTIEGSDGRSVHVEAQLQGMTIELQRQGDVVTVRIEQEERDLLEKLTALFGSPRQKAIVTVHVPYDCAVQAKTVTGKLRLSHLGAPVVATVVTGQNSLADLSGPVDARVTTGALTYAGALSAEQHRFAAVTGSIRLALTEEPNGRLQARALTGDAHCDFPLTEANVKQIVPGKQLRGIIGAGVGHLDIRVVTGSIHIKSAGKKREQEAELALKNAL
jgi:hypothetical protein